MKYKVGDKVRIKSLDWYYENQDSLGNVNCGEDNFFLKEMVNFCGEIITIESISKQLDGYFVSGTLGIKYFFNDIMIEGLVESNKQKMFLDEACEWLKNTIDDDVLVKCGSVIKCMDVDDFVLYFRKAMEG